MTPSTYQILFVCLGNICRSPLAEGVCRHLLNQRELASQVVVDSCGTGDWHVGQPPHRETRRVAKKHGVSLDGQTARQLAQNDFDRFDLIVAMDRENLADIKRLTNGGGVRIILLREYDEHAESLDVPDPYYGGPEGFEEVYHVVRRSLEKLVDEVEETLSNARNRKAVPAGPEME